MKRYIPFMTLVCMLIFFQVKGQDTPPGRTTSLIPTSIGISGAFGVGFSHFNTGIVTEKNEKIKISAGGGMTVGLNFLTSITRNWLLGNEINYHFTSMMPQVNNATGTFNNWNYCPTIQRVFPFSNNEMAILLGAGAAVNMAAKFEFDATKIPGGAHNKYYYNSAIGPVAEIHYILWNAEGPLGANCGIRYTYITYKLQKVSSDGKVFTSDQLNSLSLPKDIFKPDGSGLDFIFSLLYSF